MNTHWIMLADGAAPWLEAAATFVMMLLALAAAWGMNQKTRADGAAAHAKLELKVDTMWDNYKTAWEFQIRRAQSEAVAAGHAQMNSPITFNTETLALLAPIAPQLKAYVGKLKELSLDTYTMGLCVEKMFGQKLVNIICLPKNMKHGECLLAALCVGLGTDTIELESGMMPLNEFMEVRNKLKHETEVAI